MSDTDLKAFERRPIRGPASLMSDTGPGRVIEETMEEGASIEALHPSLAPEPELREPDVGIGKDDTRHVMLDIETWGKSSYALPVSVGAVIFDPKKPFDEQTYQSFYARIDPMSAERAGMRMDAATVDYWMDKSMADAREALRESAPQDFHEVMYGLATFMNGAAHAPGQEYTRTRKVWSYGSVFDIVILRNAFAAAALECPWTYRDERCYRTIKALAGKIEWMDMHAKQGNIKIPHHALYDATYQANGLLWIIHQLKLSID